MPFLSSSARPQSPSPSRPNIVFLCSDQHGAKYAGYMGHPVVQTPHLDRIASEGVAFTSNYTGHPLCAPGRACMMTGVYGSDVNSFCNSTVWDGSYPTWTKRLKDAGYHVWGVGKMDLDDAHDMGFPPKTLGNGHCTDPDITSFFRRPSIFRANERPQINGRSRNVRHRDQDKINDAIRFIRDETPGLEQPWVAYIGLHMPHPAFIGFKEHFDAYLEKVDMPNVPEEYLENLHEVYQSLRHFKRIATPIPEDRIRRARAAYYAMVTEMDEFAGQLYDALKESGKLENTLFIYTSDHGEALGDHGLWLKNNLFDPAARVPLLIAGADIPKGKTCDIPVGHPDLVATILERAGLGRPEKLRGHSLTPLMQGRQGDHPGFAFSEVHSEGNCTGSFLIRKGDWKYIHFTWYDGLLFNVKEDPNEMRNRIADPECKEIAAELRAILESLLDPEEVTIRAFQRQKKMRDDFAARMPDEQLIRRFTRRLGEGQSRAIVSMLRGK